MAISSISLCSNALLLLGHDPIASFDEGTVGARVAANLYDSSKRHLLSMHRWRFAVRKVALSKLTAAPLNEWQYQYQLPSDYVLSVRVFPEVEFEIYGDKLVSNQDALSMDYLYNASESQFPSYFVKVMELYLAAQFAIPITDDTSKADIYGKFFLQALAQARYTDSQGRPSAGISDAPFIMVR